MAHVEEVATFIPQFTTAFFFILHPVHARERIVFLLFTLLFLSHHVPSTFALKISIKFVYNYM